LKSWKTKPMLRRRNRARSSTDIEASGLPPTTTSPEVGSSRLPAMVRRVDFPDPLGPMTATSDPASTESDTPSRARTWAAPLP
jgi:hypothetical protein